MTLLTVPLYSWKSSLTFHVSLYPYQLTAMPANAPPNGNAKLVAASSSGTATPASSKDASDSLPTSTGGKPDKKTYETDQAKIKAEIDALQAQLVTDISACLASEPANTHSLTSEYRPRQDRFCDQIWSGK
jgi:hypothetical protein